MGIFDSMSPQERENIGPSEFLAAKGEAAEVEKNLKDAELKIVTLYD